MNEPNTETGTPTERHREHHHPHTVTVTVDGIPHNLPAGEYVVSEFKGRVKVDAARELDQVIHGEFKPLDENARICISGCEVFVSHVRTGGSS